MASLELHSNPDGVERVSDDSTNNVRYARRGYLDGEESHGHLEDFCLFAHSLNHLFGGHRSSSSLGLLSLVHFVFKICLYNC